MKKRSILAIVIASQAFGLAFAKEWNPPEPEPGTGLLAESVLDTPRGGVTACSANAIIDQNYDGTNGPNASTSDAAVDFLVAESFSDNGSRAIVTDGNATDIKFWGIQLEFNAGFTGPCDATASDFTIASWTDADGPDTIIQAETVTAAANDTGIEFAIGANVFEFTASLTNLDLQDAGWISIQRETTPPPSGADGCYFLWVTNEPPAGDGGALQINTAAPSVTVNENDQSMCLEGSITGQTPASGPEQVTGLEFEGSVTGISGGFAWASDMQMTITGPSGSSFTIGGFDNETDPTWDFAGPGSTDDGTYFSDHAPFFLSPTDLQGDWTIQFTNDWSTSDATQCWTQTTVTLIRGDGSEEVLAIPDGCYAGGASETYIIPAGTVIPETELAIPVNNFWALMLLMMIIGGLGLVVLRRNA